EVRLGQTQVRIFRSQVARLHIQVAAEGFLYRKIPLLRVARSYFSIGTEYALPQPRVRVRRRHLHRGTVCQQKRWAHVVERLLADGLHERKLRQCERRSDAGMLEPDYSISRPDHPRFADAIRESNAGSEGAAIQFTRRVGKIEHLRLQVEDGALV